MEKQLAVAVLKLKSLHEEKKANADEFNIEIKSLEKEIFSLALEVRNGQGALFKTEVEK